MKSKSSPKVSIALLADYAEHVPVLASWFYEEWGRYNPGSSVGTMAEALRANLNRDKLPLTLVALSDSSPVGTVTLRPHDMDTRTELSPWVARVYVPPERRGQGVGQVLVEAACEQARRLRFETLYLYTLDKEDFYARLGWTTLERTTYRQLQVVIMWRRL